jgi:acetolactate synthase I/II/III large subunit
VATVIADLARASQAGTWPDRAGWREQGIGRVTARHASIAASASESKGLHPFVASEIVARHIDPQTIVVGDGALTYLWLSEVVAQARPAAFLAHGYLGSMGVGFGTAIGVETVQKVEGRRTILVTGDGAVGFNIAEFDTAVRHDLPLIVVVMNNRSWGATLHFQQLAVGANRVTNTHLENGAYERVAEAFGASSYCVSNAEELDAALAEALAVDKPACINVMVELDPIPPEEMIIIGMDPFAPAATG